MMMGIVAGQMRQPVSGAAVRPVLVATAVAAGNVTSFAVPLPAGWEPGQLAVLVVSSSVSGSLSLTGWTSVGTVQNGASLYAHLYWRILQSGDSFTIPSGGRRSAICITFAAGTFDTLSPITQIVQATGTSNSLTVADAATFPAGLHYRLMLGYAYGYGVAPTYPYPYAQRTIQVSNGTNANTYAIATSSGDAFDGGGDPGSTITVTNTPPWVARKVVIRGKTS